MSQLLSLDFLLLLRNVYSTFLGTETDIPSLFTMVQSLTDAFIAVIIFKILRLGAFDDLCSRNITGTPFSTSFILIQYPVFGETIVDDGDSVASILDARLVIERFTI